MTYPCSSQTRPRLQLTEIFHRPFRCNRITLVEMSLRPSSLSLRPEVALYPSQSTGLYLWCGERIFSLELILACRINKREIHAAFIRFFGLRHQRFQFRHFLHCRFCIKLILRYQVINLFRWNHDCQRVVVECFPFSFFNIFQFRKLALVINFLNRRMIRFCYRFKGFQIFKNVWCSVFPFANASSL